MTSWTGIARAATAALLCAGLVPMGVAHAGKDRYEVGESVPQFTLKVVNAQELGETSYLALDKFFGPNAKLPKKAILVSFFATYCEPCKREMPYLAALYDTYKDKGLQILLITIDKEAEKIDIARSLAKEAAVKFPLLADRFNIVARRYFIEKLPCVYILDADGKVAMVNVGYSDDDSKKLLDQIRKNIGEPISDPIPESLAKYLNHGGKAAGGNGGEAAPGKEGGEGDKPATGDDKATGDKPEGGEAAAAAAAEEDKGKKKKKKGRKKKRRKKKK